MCSNSIVVIRKRKLNTESGPCFKFLRLEEESSTSIIKSIFKSLIETLFFKVGKRKHHATISTKTLYILKREFPWLLLISEENDFIGLLLVGDHQNQTTIKS